MPKAVGISQQPINGYIDVLDRGGDVARLQVKTNSLNILAAENLISNMADYLADITKGLVFRWGVTSDNASMTVTAADVANGVSVEEKAQISVRLTLAAVPQAGQTKWGKVNIPAPIDAMFSGASGELYNIVDPTNPELVLFLQNYTAGAGVLPAATLSDYQTILDPTVESNVKGKRVPDLKRGI